MEKVASKKKAPFVIVIAVVIIAVIVCVVAIANATAEKEAKREVVAVSTLERIVDVSELSTFTATYNGIAKVMNEKKEENIDFYVSYEAKVNAGIDFNKNVFTIDDDAKEIHVTLPEVEITDIVVDIDKMDYIFVNDKANTSGVSERAYKACEKDVETESSREDAILELAYQSAINTVKALIAPFVEQLDNTYAVIIE